MDDGYDHDSELHPSRSGGWVRAEELDWGITRQRIDNGKGKCRVWTRSLSWEPTSSNGFRKIWLQREEVPMPHRSRWLRDRSKCLGRQSIDGWRLRPAAMHVMRCCHGASRGEPDVFRPLDVIVEGSSMPVDGEVKVWVVPRRLRAMVGEEKASGPWDRSECGHLHMATLKGPVSCGPACLTGGRCGPRSIKQESPPSLH